MTEILRFIWAFGLLLNCHNGAKEMLSAEIVSDAISNISAVIQFFIVKSTHTHTFTYIPDEQERTPTNRMWLLLFLFAFAFTFVFSSFFFNFGNSFIIFCVDCFPFATECMLLHFFFNWPRRWKLNLVITNDDDINRKYSELITLTHSIPHTNRSFPQRAIHIRIQFESRHEQNFPNFSS